MYTKRRGDLPDLLEPLNVLTQLGVDLVGGDLHVVAVLEVLLPVEEPVGHLEGLGVLHDGDDLLQLVLVQLTGPENASDSRSAMRFLMIHIDKQAMVIAHAAPP